MAHLRLMPDDPQPSLLPFDAPDSVLNTCEQVQTRLRRLSPDFEPLDCLVIQGEFALVQMCLDRIEAHIRHRVREQAKRLGLIAS